MKDNSKRVRYGMMMVMITVILAIIPLVIKSWIRNNMGVDQNIELSPLFYLNYTKHYCHYLKLENGLTVFGRIFVLIDLAVATGLAIFSEKRRSGIVTGTTVTLIIASIAMNMIMTPVSMEMMAQFIIELTGIAVGYTFMSEKHLNNKVLHFMIAVFIAGSIGNIVEQNTIGYVTDYLYFLPAYGFRATSNLEDWMNWLTLAGFAGYAAAEIIKYVVNTFRVYMKQKNFEIA